MINPLNQNEDDIMNTMKKVTSSLINCHSVGRIVEYNPQNCTATIQLMQYKRWYDQTIKPAPIHNVPLLMVGCLGATITMPNPVGSNCLVMFLDRNVDSFLATGEMYLPDTDRMHSVSDAVAFCTFNTNVDGERPYSDDNITISNERSGGKIEVQASKIKLSNGLEGNDNQSLLKLLNGLIDEIKGIKCGSYAVDEASQQALEGYKATLGGLLE